MPEGAGVDQLDFAFADVGLLVADDPDVGGNAGVVEHVGGQADDRLHHIIFQHIAAYLALAGACAAGEQRGAVQDDAEPAAAVLGVAHLRDEVQQKQQGAITDAGQPRPKSTVVPLLLGFPANFFFDLLPFHAKRWIRQHVVKVLTTQFIIRQRVAEGDVGDVLPFDEHVRLADGVGLRIEFLTVHDQAGIGVVVGEMFSSDAEHAAGTGGGVVQVADHARLGKRIIIFDEDEIHHQLDDFTRGEVLTGGFVGKFGELADQFLKHQTHFGVADLVGVQVDGGEFLCDHVQQTSLIEPVDLGVELKPLEDVTDGGAEAVDVVAQVLSNVVLIPHQLLQVQLMGVVKVLA